jgi:hypothetical protein
MVIFKNSLSAASMPTQLVTAMIVTTALISTLMLVSCHRNPGIDVVVINQTPNPLTEVRITFTNGVAEAALVPVGQPYTFHIYPNGPSHLNISFSDSAGLKHERPIDTYFESGYAGKITITITAQSEVMWKDEISVLK